MSTSKSLCLEVGMACWHEHVTTCLLVLGNREADAALPDAVLTHLALLDLLLVFLLLRNKVTQRAQLNEIEIS